jgi:hypothetical protein
MGYGARISCTHVVEIRDGNREWGYRRRLLKFEEVLMKRRLEWTRGKEHSMELELDSGEENED